MVELMETAKTHETIDFESLKKTVESLWLNPGPANDQTEQNLLRLSTLNLIKIFCLEKDKELFPDDDPGSEGEKAIMEITEAGDELSVARRKSPYIFCIKTIRAAWERQAWFLEARISFLAEDEGIQILTNVTIAHENNKIEFYNCDSSCNNYRFSIMPNAKQDRERAHDYYTKAFEEPDQ